jgi:hypothetical protein
MTINRRNFLAGSAILAATLGLPAQAATSITIPSAERPSPRLALLLRKVSQMVIPRTDTLGAGDVGVGDFVALALAHGLEVSLDPLPPADPSWPLRADGSLRYGLWLEQELNRRAKGDFLRQPPAKQAAILAALDVETFPAGQPPAQRGPWAVIKALIVTGYYNSEAGASKELQYNLIPGRWDADIPLQKGDRAFSSDWTAVEFG